MKSQSRYGKRVGLYILAAAGWILLSCSLSLPFTSSSPSTGGGSGVLLQDPTVGLADMAGYHATLSQGVTGTLKGAAFEHHMKLELTRAPATGDYDFSLTIQGSAEPSTYLRVIGLGPATYAWNSPDGHCAGEYDEQSAKKLIDPTAMLSPVSKATKVGNESANGIPATHYRFDQNALAWADPKTKIAGEIWIANTGGYVVKYLLNVSAPSKPDPIGAQVAQTWDYEVGGTDGSASVALPKGCLEVLTDVPVMPDARSLIRANGMTDFVTASTGRQVLDFYSQKLPPLGWKSDKELPAGDVRMPFAVSFTSGSRRISLHLAEAKPSGVDVTFLLLGAVGSSAATEPGAKATATPKSGGATATPGVQPTVNQAESGLPEDVPLYPGAIGLTKLNDQVVEFSTGDTPDQVDQYYQQQMPAQKWTLLSSTKQGVNIIQIWQKDNRIVSISILPQGGKTVVMITFQAS
ncbi:MAG TPA: hypothetical protein VII90_04485 [Anaerolineales bacterium]